MVTIPTNSQIPSRNRPVPSGFVPEGVQEGLFDENTLYLIKHALPEIYQRIFAHLLYHATTDPRSAMQLSLFEKTGEANHEAIILYRSVADLSKSPNSPAGPETYHKAILLFEALKVLRRAFHRGFTEVRMPLGKREILIPALLQSLRELHGDEKRKGYNNVKVKQLARKVAKTLQSGEFLAGIPHPTPTGSILELKEVLTHLLLEHGIADTQVQQTTLTQACTLITQAMLAVKNGRVPDEAGESAKQRARRAWTKSGDSFSQPGDSLSHEGASTQVSSTKGADHEGESLETESPTLPCSSRQFRGRHLKKGELDAIFGEESPENDGNLLFSAKLGDSSPSLSIIVPSPHVITNKGVKTLIDAPLETAIYTDTRPHKEIQKEAFEYQNRFDKGRGRQWPGSLYNAVKLTSPEIRYLAAIATHYYMVFRLPNGEVVKRPGGLFTRTCELYRQPGAEIPKEVQAWADTGLSLSEIEVKLKQGLRHPGQPQLSFGQTDAPLDQKTSTQREEDLDGASQSEERYELPTSLRPTAYDWMNQDEANDLQVCIERERGQYRIEAYVEPGEEDGVFVVVTTWDDAEIIHHSTEEWTTYFAGMKDYLEM